MRQAKRAPKDNSAIIVDVAPHGAPGVNEPHSLRLSQDFATAVPSTQSGQEKLRHFFVSARTPLKIGQEKDGFQPIFYRQMEQMTRNLVSGREIKLAANEGNTSLPLPQQHSIQSALYAARLMNVFERSGDLVQMSAVSDMVSGRIQRASRAM